MLFFVSWVFCLLFSNNIPLTTNSFIFVASICTFVIISNSNSKTGVFLVTKPLTIFFIKVNLNSFIQTIYFLVKKLKFFPSNFLKLKWKPLFKKSSYFGIYRATRNQFLNK